jgi:hypothetical protein
MRLLPFALLGCVVLAPQPACAYVALMAGQSARALQGQFNNVPVLHSNQPEEVLGPGILVDTRPGSAVAAETNQPLPNATYTFNGDFGLHVHHKYGPADRSQIRKANGRRGELTLAAILINPGAEPVRIRFSKGAVRNSFEAPYLVNNLMGVKPLGPRPWNTGPGDATAVQMLRGKLDRKLESEIVVPAHGRTVLFSTDLPALGIANALLKGHSDGQFQMAVVAARDPQSNADLFAVLDRGRLAPGRIYLSRIRQIENGTVYSRVAGVALGDAYSADLDHDLSQGALHVPLTSTTRHHFGTREVQVNQLATRMLDSSLDNVGTYGVRFDVTLNLRGSGAYQLVLSHPSPNGRNFTAFRGSIGIQTSEGYREVHVGMRSGESLAIAPLTLQPGQNNPVTVSLVYPADCTPGHLLSVVSDQQLAQLRSREELLAAAQHAPVKAAPPASPPTTPAPQPAVKPAEKTKPPIAPIWNQALPTLQGMPAAVITPGRMSRSLMERYQQAVRAQQHLMNTLRGR